ncbi:MAG TPA: rod shape-determining protein MreC [Anaerolineae bacterium]|nr:rod shape-determining protein MreC [Anaerolineae bacterium]
MNRGRSRAWLFAALTLLTIALLLLHESGAIKPLEDAAQVALDPIQRALSSLFNGLGEAFDVFRDLRELRERNEQLQTLNDELITENVRLKEIEAENITLRSLLNFRQENPIYLTQAAAIIFRDPSPYRQFVTINAGRREGLEAGMPVITAGSALVGRISEVGLASSKVQLVIDSTSAINVRIQSSRVSGLAEGQPDAGLVMTQIPLDATANVGDIVLTSGLGGNLPRALVVGQVTEVTHRDIDLFQSAILRPAVDFNRLELVLVITDFEELPVEPEIEPTVTPTPSPLP